MLPNEGDMGKTVTNMKKKKLSKGEHSQEQG